MNETWATLAHATANNELGIAAKIAPRPPFEEQRRDRLICVYTADFNDKTDVGRVLQRLRELRLVETRGRVLYYKPGESQPSPCVGILQMGGDPADRRRQTFTRMLVLPMAILGAWERRYIAPETPSDGGKASGHQRPCKLRAERD